MIGLAFFVYRRPEHTRKVIESIRRNHFEKIYIFQDGLKQEKDRAEWEEVSALIKGIDFAETELHISERNQGLANSIIAGMNYVFERHEEAIALEDDVVLADGYRSLMEAMFDVYRNNKRVMGVCGGGSGAVIPKTYVHDVYFSYRMSSIAFGTWRDRWIGYERDPRVLTEIYRDEEKRKMLECAGNDLEKMVFLSMTGKIDTWATYWNLHQVNNRGYHVVPVKGYAIDIGRTGGGTNSTESSVRNNCELDGEKKEKYDLPQEIFTVPEIVENIKSLLDIVNDKMEIYFDILCMWMRLYQRGGSTLSYFQNRKLERIYVYGIRNLAEFLLKDIGENIEVAGYIVEHRRDVTEYRGKKVYDMTDCAGLEDIPIVITPSYDIAFIRHFFKKCNISNEIILIEDVVKYALDQKGDSNDK